MRTSYNSVSDSNDYLYYTLGETDKIIGFIYQIVLTHLNHNKNYLKFAQNSEEIASDFTASFFTTIENTDNVVLKEKYNKILHEESKESDFDFKLLQIVVERINKELIIPSKG